MPLFAVAPEGVVPLRHLGAATGVYEKEIEELFWLNLSELIGVELFGVTRQAHLTGGGIVDILALDQQGNVTVIEVKRSIEREHWRSAWSTPGGRPSPTWKRWPLSTSTVRRCSGVPGRTSPVRRRLSTCPAALAWCSSPATSTLGPKLLSPSSSVRRFSCWSSGSRCTRTPPVPGSSMRAALRGPLRALAFAHQRRRAWRQLRTCFGLACSPSARSCNGYGSRRVRPTAARSSPMGDFSWPMAESRGLHRGPQ